MPRLNFIVEGHTEEGFVNDVLRHALAESQVWAYVRRVELSRDKKRGKVYRGGLFDYGRAKRDVTR